MPSEPVILAVVAAGALALLLGALVYFHRAGGSAGDRVAAAEIALAEDDTADLELELERVLAQLEEEKRGHAESRRRFARVLQLAVSNAEYRGSLASLGLADGRGSVDGLREWLRLNGADDEGGPGSEGAPDPDSPPSELGAD